MNRSWIDQLKNTKEVFNTYWGARSTKQKRFIIGTLLFLIVSFSTFIYLASRPQYVPLYTGELSQRDIGDIKAELDKEGYKNYQLSDQGTMILVPRKDAPSLLVSLASKGYPKDNKINFDVFSQNLSFGATDRQYDVLEQQAMQNQLADVLKQVDGVKNAQVILTLPQNSVFVRPDKEQKATASVMVEVEPGTQLSAQQIRALYTLVSRSVPNLPMENITIMNQYSETLRLPDSNDDGQNLDQYDQQKKIRQDMEQEIQQNLQSMLGTIMGPDKVYVQTFVKLNFDQVKTEEKLVEPTDKKNNGIAVSSEKISKTFHGKGASPGGVVGTGSSDIPGYQGANSSGNSDYEELQNRVNYDVDRINNQIVKSPYQIDDITINVGVEPPDPTNPNSLTPDVQDNVRNIVSNVVRTALGHKNLTQQDIDQRITIFPRTFAGKQVALQNSGSSIPWIPIGIGAVILSLGGLVWFFLRRRKQKQEESDLLATSQMEPQRDYFAEQDLTVESQLKKLLDQRPEDFSKVIKSWLHEEEA
jgi:flagellar M-ring protein FliF